MQYATYFKGKKITVMGLGLLGRGVGDARFLAECGAEVLVTDLKSEAELALSVEQLQTFSNISFALGGHRFEDFEGKDMILVSAGVPKDSSYLLHAQEKGIECAMSGALFAKCSGIPIIGVTGTRGKSTVAHMIHHALTIITGEEILLGGNIRGVSNLQLLNKVKEDSLAVFELDSWQLQGFGWAKVSPQVAVFTNFMSDHQNYYRGNIGDYFKDKAQIFLHQKESDVFITTPEVFERAKMLPGVTLGQEVVFADASVLPEDFTLRIPGEHNRQNASLAFEALRALGLDEEEILNALATFPGVPGRLEYLDEIDGVKIYNDNNATTPEATAVALRTLGSEKKNIILIVGGAYKEVDPAPLLPLIEQYCKEIILIPGTGTDILLSLLREHSIPTIVTQKNTLDEAVQHGRTVGAPGDILLFSPAFASFGQYKNEYERNDEFVSIINSLY